MTTLTATVGLSGEAAPDSFIAGSNAWTVTLGYDGRELTVPFFTGPALGEPDGASVLECLLFDASYSETDPWDAAEELGFEDSEVLRSWVTIEHPALVAQNLGLRELLGDEYEAAVTDPEEFVNRVAV
jgi:hypothetical protein